MIFENVRHGDQLDVFIAGEQIYNSLCATAAATYQSGLQAVR